MNESSENYSEWKKKSILKDYNLSCFHLYNILKMTKI